MAFGGVLALDLATNVGWCFGEPGEAPRSGSFRVGEPGCKIGRFLALFEDHLAAQVATFSPALIAFEAPIITGGKTSIDTARKLLGLAGETEKVAYRRGVRCLEESNSTVSKWFAGKGRFKDRNEKKATTMAVCRALGWSPKDDDQADACALWSFACSIVAPKVPFRRWEGALLGVSP